MRFGASTFIWVSPFSTATLDLIDKVADFGFDLIEICVEDPATIDTAAIARRLDKARIKATVCGAFGPDRDISSDEAATRENGLAYIKRCVEIAADLGSPLISGPMYSAVGRINRLRARCSKIWADQPEIRAMTNNGVNIGVGRASRQSMPVSSK